jgi:toxin ParE1/3/4
LNYRIEVAAAAMRDAEEYSRFILNQSHDDLPAKAWRAGLRATIATLEQLPARCPLIPEREKFSEDLHQLLYHSHRVIFRIEPYLVRILRIYHANLRPLETMNQRPKLGTHRKTGKLDLL